MQKLIILALLATVSLCAITACDATATGNGFTNANGKCQYCHPTCKTCKGPLETDCTACKGITTGFTDATCAAVPLTKANASDTHGSCKCASDKKLGVKTLDGSAADFECCPVAKVSKATGCPLGFGLVTHATDNIGCELCTEGTCKTCAPATNAAHCTACISGTADATSKKCKPATATDFLVPYYGEGTPLPAGYWSNVQIAQPILDNCTAQTAAGKCDTCAADHGFKDSTQAVCQKCEHGIDATTKICLPWGCKKLDADKVKCAAQECDTVANFAENAAAAAMCECKAGHYKKEKTAAVAAQGTTPASPATYECAACDQVNGAACSACTPNADNKSSNCTSSGSNNTNNTNTTTTAVAGSNCSDATLKASGCATCSEVGTAKVWTCSACTTGTRTSTLSNGLCECTAGFKAAAWTGSTCVACTTPCTGSNYCNLKSGSTTEVECTQSTPEQAAAARALAAGGNGGNASSNSILISAISMILAVILA